MSGLTLESFHAWMLEVLPKCSYRLTLDAKLVYYPAYQQKDFIGILTKYPMKYEAESAYWLYLTKDVFEKEKVKMELESKTLDGLQMLIRQECLLTPEEQRAEIARIVNGVAAKLAV